MVDGGSLEGSGNSAVCSSQVQANEQKEAMTN